MKRKENHGGVTDEWNRKRMLKITELRTEITINSTAPARKGEKNKGGRKVERKNTHEKEKKEREIP